MPYFMLSSLLLAGCHINKDPNFGSGNSLALAMAILISFTIGYILLQKLRD